MVLTLKKAEHNLISAQKEAARAYKNVEKARNVYNNLLNKSVGGAKKRTLTKGRKKSTVTKDKKKSTVTKSKKKSTVTKGRKRSTKKSTTKKRAMRGPAMRGGGGSDWLNTVNSRGNVDGPDGHWGVNGQKWSSQFEKSGEYISNSELRRGGFQLQESAALAPKVPYGLYPDASVRGQFGSGADLGTQRV